MVDGSNKQLSTIGKEYVASPTKALEFMLLTSITDSEEGRYVVIIDITNTLIQARIEDEGKKSIIRMKGKIAELLLMTAP